MIHACKMSSICAIVLVQLIALSSFTYGQQNVNEISLPTSGSNDHIGSKQSDQSPLPASAINGNKINLEPRIGDQSFVKDIVDRLHALDADIGKLLYNSTSMYAPNDQSVAYQESSKGGEKFTEVLNDLDSLQDEIGVLVNNATRSRQYNILIRLRPLNNILYRIRHNLHLVRNSLVAINTVSSLEKLGNSVLDSTLQAFMRPDANLNDEIGDNGNYEFDLDKMDSTNSSSTVVSQPLEVAFNSTALTSSSTTLTNSSTTLTMAKPQPIASVMVKSTPLPVASTTATSTTAATPTSAAPPSSSTASSSTTIAKELPSTERQVASTRRPTQRPTRRANQRQGQRRTSPRPTTPKLEADAAP